MTKIISIAGLLLLLAIPALAVETAYSSVMDDFPLMQGMKERPEDTVFFDNPGGRIVEFSAATAQSPEAVKNFYRQALPPLGWKVALPTKFVRDTETLKIDFDKKDGETIVHFALAPVNGGK